MLTPEQCRALLHFNSSLSDEEIIELRNSLYELAAIGFDLYWSEIQSDSKNPFGLLKVENAPDNV